MYLSEHKFDATILSHGDLWIALKVLGYREDDPDEERRIQWLEYAKDALSRPDAVVSHDGTPIMFRWHLVPRNDFGNVYLHIQVADDDVSRGPHDHRYDSQASILSGSYWDCTFRRIPRNRIENHPSGFALRTYKPTLYHKGQIVRRQADQLHLIKLAEGCPYTMTIFATGREYRKWGFANPDGSWTAAEAKGEVVNGCVIADGRSAT